MFVNHCLMLPGLDRFRGLSAPVREAAPVVGEETLDGGPTRDPLGRLGLIPSEGEKAGDDLAHLGLVKGREERDDLSVLGLVLFLP